MRPNVRTGMAALASLWAAAATAAPTTVTLPAVADTTIFADNDQAASGADDNFFAGVAGNTSGFAERRGLLRFDVTTIPPNAVVQTAAVTLSVTRTNAGSFNHSLYRVVNSWGEGTSTSSAGGGMGGPPTPNSATWAYRLFDMTLWTQPGGDFVTKPSATRVVSGTGAYTWSAPGLIGDVQSWIQNPTSNSGWIVIAETAAPNIVTAKRFASREFANASQRPVLTITYDVPAAADAPLPIWASALLAGTLLVLLGGQRWRT